MLISGKVTLKLNVCKKNHALSLCITSIKDSPNYRMCTIPYNDPIVTLMYGVQGWSAWTPPDPPVQMSGFMYRPTGEWSRYDAIGGGGGATRRCSCKIVYTSHRNRFPPFKRACSVHGGKSLLVHAQIHCLMEGVLSCKGNTRKSQLSYAISCAMDSIFGPSCSTFLSIMDQCGLYIL